MKFILIVPILMTSTISFADSSFRQHTCTPVNPSETKLEALEVIGHLPEDFTGMNVAYSVRVKSISMSGAPKLFERPVTISSGHKIDAPLVYEGQGFKLDVEYYAAPGGDGRQHLGIVEFTDHEFNKISTQVVCRTSLIK